MNITGTITHSGGATIEEIRQFLQRRIGFDSIPNSRQTQSTEQRAQTLIHQAWHSPDRKERIKLARQALRICDTCADTYFILAQDDARNLHEARNLLEKGLQAGRQGIGKADFDRYEGQFWHILKTRPYMRVKGMLAEVLWELGEAEAAIDHLYEMLTLNVRDDQGIHNILITYLIQIQDWDAAENLIQSYDDQLSFWVYSKALVLFKQHGKSNEARQAMREAIDANRHVAAMLLGESNIPKHLPVQFQYGDRTEAAIYVAHSQQVWQFHRQALGWMRGVYYRM